MSDWLELNNLSARYGPGQWRVLVAVALLAVVASSWGVLQQCVCDERGPAAQCCAVQGQRSDVRGDPVNACPRERAGVSAGLLVPGAE
jgi:hypothetical protein